MVPSEVIVCNTQPHHHITRIIVVFITEQLSAHYSTGNYITMITMVTHRPLDTPWLLLLADILYSQSIEVIFSEVFQ